MKNYILKILLKSREDRTIEESCNLIKEIPYYTFWELNYHTKIENFTESVRVLLEAYRLTSERN